MGNPHILAIPFPAQGHVIPLMEFSVRLVKHGFKVTFVNTGYNHKMVVSASAEKNHLENQIHLVSIPDGMNLSDSWPAQSIRQVRQPSKASNGGRPKKKLIN